MKQEYTVFYERQGDRGAPGYQWMSDQTAYINAESDEEALLQFRNENPNAVVTDVYRGHYGVRNRHNTALKDGFLL